MSGYIGAQPVPQATQHREAFTATASQTSFPTVGYTPQFVDVYLNGVKLAAADYTATNGSDIVLTTGAALNDILEYVAYTPFEVASQTFTGTTTTDVLTTTGAFTSLGIDDNAAATAVTIDASGNVLVGKTATSTASAGVELQSGTGGFSAVVATASIQPLLLNRLTTDGDIAVFRKDNTTVGSIGTSSGAIALNGASAVNLNDGTNEVGFGSLAFAGNGSGNDAVIDLGRNNRRFKDAYLSGGVYLGGAVAANKLDDYEEGTWTPTLNGGFTVTTLNRAAYTKIGRNVHIQLDMSFNGTGTSADLQIDGLPFTNATNGWATGSGYFEYVNNNYYVSPVPLVVSAAASLKWQINPSAAAGGNMPANNVDAGYMQVSVTYQVA